MGLDLSRKLARLGPPGSSTPNTAPLPIDPEKHERITRLRALIGHIEQRTRNELRVTPPRTRTESSNLPGETENTEEGPLHRIASHLPPAHCHGRIPIERALHVPSTLIAALALDPTLVDVDPRTMLFLDTETTGLSGGTGTLPFLIGMAYFEDESLRVEQLFLRRPGEERPMLRRLAERLSLASCIVTYNGKAFDWPLLRSRAVLNRIALPSPPAHLDLLHGTRRIFSRRLGQVRLVQIECDVLGMRRERDVDGAEIPSLYWDYVRDGQTSPIARIIEHNANDLIALAALLAVLGERYRDALPAHEPEDLLGVARTALRAGDLDRAERFAHCAALAGGSADVESDAWLLASQVAKARKHHQEVRNSLERALRVAEGERKLCVRLALAKHLEHRIRDFCAAHEHALELHSAMPSPLAERRVARVFAKLQRAEKKRHRTEREGSRGRRASSAPPHVMQRA